MNYIVAELAFQVVVQLATTGDILHFVSDLIPDCLQIASSQAVLQVRCADVSTRVC